MIFLTEIYKDSSASIRNCLCEVNSSGRFAGISVLCVAEKTNYKYFSGLDLYNESRNAYTFKKFNPVIAHPPCAQWSRMKGFAERNATSKNLADFCMDHILQNGGIFEHPAGSSYFKYRGIKPTCEVNQLWFGFPARKATWLYFHNCVPLPIKFTPNFATRQVNNMDSENRSIMPIAFCWYLLESLVQSMQ